MSKKELFKPKSTKNRITKLGKCFSAITEDNHFLVSGDSNSGYTIRLIVQRGKPYLDDWGCWGLILLNKNEIKQLDRFQRIDVKHGFGTGYKVFRLKPIAAKGTCKHRHTWLVAGGTIAWCYECGAIRKMAQFQIGSVSPVGCWVKPVGPGGENPYIDKFEGPIKSTAKKGVRKKRSKDATQKQYRAAVDAVTGKVQRRETR